MQVRFVPFEKIDRLLWDSCVHYANNGNLFGYHWYLKNTIQEFDGLVEGDYESVMPLIRRPNLWGQKSLLHPFPLGRLGVFSVHVLSAPRMNAFLSAIPNEYRHVEMLLNEYNKIQEVESGFETNAINWYRLPLDQPYEILREKYHSEVQRYLKESEQLNIQPTSHFKVEEVTSFLKNQNKGIDEHLWHRVHYNLMHRGTAFSTAYINSKGEIQSVGLFAYSNGYFVNLYFAAKEGKEKLLFYRLMDDMIRLQAGKPLTLDFNHLPETLQPEHLGAIKKELTYLSKRPMLEKIRRKIFGH